MPNEVPMTAQIALTDEPTTHDGRMVCYRHPDRETWVRCGRCDRPICTGCAMQGPVGMRCKQCGKPVRDALASMTGRQMLTTVGLAVGGAALVGYLGLQFGFFMLIAGFFVGGLIVQASDHLNGMKRGPRMLALVSIGIVLGAVVGGALGLLVYVQEIQATIVAGGGAGGAEEEAAVMVAQGMAWAMAPQILISALATVAGAIVRLR
jgi:hypothetical protein